MSDWRLPRHGRWNPHCLDIAAQHTYAERVKSRDHRLGDAQSANELFDALPHFRGSLIRERHRQNGLRHHALVLDQVSNAISNYARLPAARAGEDKHWPFGGFNSLTLLRIELVEKRQSRQWLPGALLILRDLRASEDEVSNFQGFKSQVRSNF